jgi:hypothetical protein
VAGASAGHRGVDGSNVVTAAAMIYPNPSDDVLKSAHLITLYDPHVPGWNLVVVDGVEGRSHSSPTWNVVDIPVDSTNPDAIDRWKDWISRARG